VAESTLVNFELLGWSNRRRLADLQPPYRQQQGAPSATTSQPRATEELESLLLPEVPRRRLGEAQVAFDVRKSLSASGLSDAAAFEASVSSDLQTALANGALAKDITESCNCTVSNLATSTAIVVRTAAPSTAPPSPQPSIAPTRRGTNSIGGDATQTGTIAGAAAGGFCLLFLAGVGLYMYRKKSTEDNLWLDSAMQVKSESFRGSTGSEGDLENPLSEKAVLEKGEPVMLERKHRQDLDNVGRQSGSSRSKKKGTEVELMSQHHQSYMHDFALDDDHDPDEGSATKGKGKGKGEKRTPKGSRGAGKKPLVPKPRTRKAPIDLSIGHNKKNNDDDDNDDAAVSSSGPPVDETKKTKRKDGSSLDAMVSEAVNEDKLESAIFERTSDQDSDSELDDDVNDSDDSVEGEDGVLAAISAAEASRVGAASEGEEPVSEDEENQDDIVARLSGKSLPSEDVIVQDLLEAVTEGDGAALRAAAACAMTMEKKKRSRKSTYGIWAHIPLCLYDYLRL